MYESTPFCPMSELHELVDHGARRDEAYAAALNIVATRLHSLASEAEAADALSDLSDDTRHALELLRSTYGSAGGLARSGPPEE